MENDEIKATSGDLDRLLIALTKKKFPVGVAIEKGGDKITLELAEGINVKLSRNGTFDYE